MLDDLNLRVSSVRFITRRGYDVTDDLDRRVDGTKAVMKLAYQLGSSVVVNSIGQVPTTEQGEVPSHLVQALEDLGKFGAYVGAILLAETGNGTGADLMGLLESCLSGYVGVALNPVNWILEGRDLRSNIAAVAPRVQLVEASDAVRMKGTQNYKGGEVVPLGQGLAEFPEILGLLEDHQYRGWFVLDGSSATNPYAEAKRSMTYLKNL
jgi:sugar phosphate isomerase/epimerase